jgi:Spherulation-specific family 4
MGSPLYSVIRIPPQKILTPSGMESPLILCRITKHPTVNFIIVVNPNSGPGDSALPDEHYTREIPRLNAYPNVRTVGYISTNWGNRALPLALKDISTYSGWSKNSAVPGLSVQGIFLDETPAVYTPSGLKFLNTVDAAIKFQPGLGTDPLVSGTIVSSFSCSGNFRSEPCQYGPIFLSLKSLLLESKCNHLKYRTNSLRR